MCPEQNSLGFLFKMTILFCKLILKLKDTHREVAKLSYVSVGSSKCSSDGKRINGVNFSIFFLLKSKCRAKVEGIQQT